MAVILKCIWGEKTKSDQRATKQILYDMGNFFMPTDQVMAFLCFISDNQSVDMSGQVWGGGRGGHN